MSNRNTPQQTAGRGVDALKRCNDKMEQSWCIMPPEHPAYDGCPQGLVGGRTVGLDEELNCAIHRGNSVEDLVECIDYVLFGTPRTEQIGKPSNEPSCQPCIDTQVAMLNNTNNRVHDRLSIIRDRLRSNQ